MDATTPDSRGTRHPRHWAGRWLCGPAARLSSVLTLMGFIAACQAAPTAPPPTPSPTPGDPVGLSLRQPADIDQVIASGEWDVRVSDVQLGVSAYRLAQQKIGAIDTARLGAVFGLDTGTTGAHYFDAFEDRRVHTVIGAEASLPDRLFTNSFESNSLANWVVYGPGITTTPAANLAPGQSIGAAVAVTSTRTTRYLEDLTPNRESRYRARVYFDPNGLTMAVNHSFNLLNITTGTTEIGRLEFQYVATGYRLRGAVRNDASAYTYTGWTTLADSAHVLEIDWRAATGPGANDGGLTLWIDGTQVGALSGVDNDTRRVDRARIGAVGLDAGTTGTFYLDAFESRRASAIGPVQVAGSALTTTAIAYGYDPLYRLTSASYSDGTLFGYQYDAVGNVLTKTQTISGTPALQTYAYDDANRQTSAAGLAQTHDSNGNLLSDGTTAYDWDGANRMTASGSTAYTYNGLNDRVSAGGVTHQLDLNAGLTQVLADGTNTYLYGAGRLGEQQSAAWQYHLADGLGSVRQLADASGAVSAAKSYEPYGEVLNSAGSASSAYGFTGEQQNSGNLVYLRARYYQTETMRFAGRDTWSGADYSPISLNKWLYAAANPALYVDPMGTCWVAGNSWESIRRIAEPPVGGLCKVVKAVPTSVSAPQTFLSAGPSWTQEHSYPNLQGYVGPCTACHIGKELGYAPSPAQIDQARYEAARYGVAMACTNPAASAACIIGSVMSNRDLFSGGARLSPEQRGLYVTMAIAAPVFGVAEATCTAARGVGQVGVIVRPRGTLGVDDAGHFAIYTRVGTDVQVRGFYPNADGLPEDPKALFDLLFNNRWPGSVRDDASILLDVSRPNVVSAWRSASAEDIEQLRAAIGPVGARTEYYSFNPDNFASTFNCTTWACNQINGAFGSSLPPIRQGRIKLALDVVRNLESPWIIEIGK